MTDAIVVTGTDTGIGKTVFAAGLTAALNGAYWKPVQSGLDDDEDSDTVACLAHLPPDRIVPPAYRLRTPCSPHRAAEIDQVEIDPARLTPPATDRPLVIEGAGGVLVPLTRTFLYADLFARWALPTILVARTALGTINHSLLSLEALRSRGVPVLGIAFVGEANDDTEATICAIGRVPRLGRLPILEALDAERLAQVFAANFKDLRP
ncbi:dethiobiotin synthase [Sphingomonas sp. IC-56]|uniref:dethiobiotin synthase n=1 Tax=Sphingomonas sp. IC-56 TaxID=2898529 RepID=UPI001E65BF0E|nr:dethiobiotin synthase [Sphingomonas sp. IC-56]MCD2325238.1 dethiobiotin synthase [Sphingomonas sp. IC-56]